MALVRLREMVIYLSAIHVRVTTAVETLKAAKAVAASALTQAPDNDKRGKWIKHSGGKMPVPADTLVRVRLKGRKISSPDMEKWSAAGSWMWGTTGHPGDIAAYQVKGK